MKPLSHLRVLLALAAALSITAVQAGIDRKFYKKAAEKVWSMELPQFNAGADLSDSIFQNQSAIYIARYVSLTADYDQSPDQSKLATVGVPVANATVAVKITRNMVKINDAAAAEYFTEFSVDPERNASIDSYKYLTIRQAFGARVIKPDGTVADVDMSTALTVTAGKNNKDDEEYKVAVAGLTPGDILDYFYYTEYMADEISIPSMPVFFLAQYPTRDFMLDCRVDPRLTLEYGAYNGAPKVMQLSTVDGKNRMSIEMQNMESLDEQMPYFSTARQMPFLDIYVLNNLARLEFVPKSARHGGVRHINTMLLIKDVASAYNKLKWQPKTVDEAVSIAKDWMKANPEATPQQIADASWLALNYAIIEQDRNVTDSQVAVMFYNTLVKLNQKALVGVTTSRRNVPVSELVRFNDATYMVRASGRTYIPSNDLARLAGEVPARYDREEYFVFTNPPETEGLEETVKKGVFPASKPADNTLKQIISVKFNPANPDELKAQTTMSLSGFCKDVAAGMVPLRTCIADLERYLGLEPMKRKRESDVEQTEENIRTNATKLLKQAWDAEDVKLISYEVKSPGCTPDIPLTEVSMAGTVTGAVTQAGNNLMVNIGCFIGRQQQVTGNDRHRGISVVTDGAHKYDLTITFEIPEGYELVEESLKDLNRSVISPDATFNTNAKTDGKTVTVRLVERYSHAVYPASSWPDLVKVMDAAHDFGKSSIILRPNKAS